jgi:hypothetical protein
MSASKSARVVLELDPGEPIAGSISGSGGPAESFRGWVELASKLERLRLANHCADDTPATTRPTS